MIYRGEGVALWLWGMYGRSFRFVLRRLRHQICGLAHQLSLSP
jgi:hypothetical protein